METVYSSNPFGQPYGEVIHFRSREDFEQFISLAYHRIELIRSDINCTEGYVNGKSYYKVFTGTGDIGCIILNFREVRIKEYRKINFINIEEVLCTHLKN